MRSMARSRTAASSGAVGEDGNVGAWYPQVPARFSSVTGVRRTGTADDAVTASATDSSTGPSRSVEKKRVNPNRLPVDRSVALIRISGPAGSRSAKSRP